MSKASPVFKVTRPSENVPNRSFGPWRSARTPIGRSAVPLDRADQIVALFVILARAMAEVEAEHIGSGFEQAADHLWAGARWSERGDDLGVAMSTHVFTAFRPPFREVQR